MATYKIGIYDHSALITSHTATCDLPTQFSDSDILDAAGKLLLGTPYQHSDVADVIDLASDSVYHGIEIGSYGWDDDIYRVDIMGFESGDPLGNDSEWQILATIEIARD